MFNTFGAVKAKWAIVYHNFLLVSTKHVRTLEYNDEPMNNLISVGIIDNFGDRSSSKDMKTFFRREPSCDPLGVVLSCEGLGEGYF